MSSRRLLLRGLQALGVAALLVSTAAAQDPVKVAPEQYRVTTENARVRILDAHIKPGEKSPMHSHPANVAVALTHCKMRFTARNGKTQEVEVQPGVAVWRDAESHAVENIGADECHVLHIDLKHGAPRKTK